MTEGAQGWDWDAILDAVGERRVVPIVGPEVLQIEVDGKTTSLYRHLAERLADALGIPERDLPRGFELNDVACAYYLRDTSGRLANRLCALLREPFPLPTSLLKLASITDFNLYVSTTPDRCLARALNRVRFADQESTETRTFSPQKRIEDLPCEADKLPSPLVFQLFGAASTAADYVITDEDLLEFIHALQRPDKHPKLLFDALRYNHLLLVGCSFPDWLARVFMRTVLDERLTNPRATRETIADDRSPTDSNLVFFMRQCKIDVFPGGGTRQFVDELHRRWEVRNRLARAAETKREDESVGEMAANAVFLSYASEDRAHVLEVRAAMEKAGIDVWLDQERLNAGATYEERIQRNIRQCSLFIPFISRQSSQRREGFFRKEWHWAIERAKGIDPSFPFIQPIRLDNTPYEAAGVPEEFRRLTWDDYTKSDSLGQFVTRTRDALRELRKRERGLA
jgi:hypothetical protein